MSFKRAPYPHEFRRQLVELVRSGRTPEELAREFEPSAQSIRNWVAAAALAERPSNEVVSRQDLDELKQLRRENRRLRQEREILAIGERDQETLRGSVFPSNAWFARETDAMPTGSSRIGRRTRPSTRLPRCAGCWTFPPAAITRGGGASRAGGRRAMRHWRHGSGRSMPPLTAPMASRVFMPSFAMTAWPWAASGLLD